MSEPTSPTADITAESPSADTGASATPATPVDAAPLAVTDADAQIVAKAIERRKAAAAKKRAERGEVQKQLDALKAQLAESVPRARFRDDPLAVLEEVGVPFHELAHRQIEGRPKPDPLAELQKKHDALEARLREREENEARTRTEALLASAQQNLVSAISSNESAYPYLASYVEKQGGKKVGASLFAEARSWREAGRELSADKLLAHVERELREHHEGLNAALTKRRSPAQSPPDVAKQASEAVPKLTESDLQKMTIEERLEALIAGRV